jgi:hypothetical protein
MTAALLALLALQWPFTTTWLDVAKVPAGDATIIRITTTTARPDINTFVVSVTYSCNREWQSMTRLVPREPAPLPLPAFTPVEMWVAAPCADQELRVERVYAYPARIDSLSGASWQEGRGQ